jgi:hypothetical protein
MFNETYFPQICRLSRSSNITITIRHSKHSYLSTFSYRNYHQNLSQSLLFLLSFTSSIKSRSTHSCLCSTVYIVDHAYTHCTSLSFVHRSFALQINIFTPFSMCATDMKLPYRKLTESAEML